MSERVGALTTKQAAFVEAYLGPARFNATQAAIAAGYSERSAYATAAETLRHPRVQSAIKAHLEALAMPAAEVLASIAEIARTGTLEANRLRALELLAKHLGLLTEKVQLSGDPEKPLAVMVLKGVSLDDL